MQDVPVGELAPLDAGAAQAAQRLEAGDVAVNVPSELDDDRAGQGLARLDLGPITGEERPGDRVAGVGRGVLQPKAPVDGGQRGVGDKRSRLVQGGWFLA